LTEPFIELKRHLEGKKEEKVKILAVLFVFQHRRSQRRRRERKANIFRPIRFVDNILMKRKEKKRKEN